MAAAVDTNVLLALSDLNDTAWDAIETLRGKAPQFDLIASPTVIHELAFLAYYGPREHLRKTARQALLSFASEWGFCQVQLTPVQHGIVEEVAGQLRRRDLIAEEERNDSFIVVEAALLDAALLVTNDSEIRGIDFARLTLLLREYDLQAPVIATCAEIVRKFFR